MKTLLAAILINLLPALAMAQPATMNNGIKSETATPAVYASYETGAGPAATTSKGLRKAVRESKQFVRARKAFATDFKNASAAQWFAGKSDYSVSFMLDNIRSVAWYSKGGSLLYTLLSYDETALPAGEQKVLAAEFSGYKINLVEEVRQANTTVYLVHLEDGCSIKLVTISDGIANVYRSYRKA